MGAEADDVVNGAAAHGDQHLHVRLQPPPQLRRGDLVGVESRGVQDHLLLRRGADQAGDPVSIGVVYGAAFSGNARLAHVRVQPSEGAGLDDAQGGGHPVLFAAPAGPAVLGRVDPHGILAFVWLTFGPVLL